MRLVIYRALLGLPFRLFGVLLGICGIIASLWPEKVKATFGGSEMTIQNVGTALLIVTLFYVVLLALLKPGPSAGQTSGVLVTGPNAVVHVHQYTDQIESELAAINPGSVEGGATPSVVVAQPDAAPPQTPTPIQGQAQILEQSDTMSATGQDFPPTVRAISPLYVGQIIISASQLADGSLEIAVRAFNGSRETIVLAGVNGAILAGINNETGAPLPTPTLRPEHIVAPVPPGAEFMIVLDQPLPGQLAQTYSDALNAAAYIALDLRELRVMMRAEDDANVIAPLPLWHGATIGRRDDIFTGRMYIAALSGAAAFNLSVSGTLEDTNEGK